MANQKEDKRTSNDRLTGKDVFIVGRKRFLNELIAFYIESETGAGCTVLEDTSDIPSTGKKRVVPEKLILLECPGTDHAEFLNRFEENYKTLIPYSFIALFDVSYGLGIEERAVANGVKGIFYNQDPLNRFKKGIRAMFDEELWVSREVLTKYVIKNRERENSTEREEALLTSREIEILTMISAGAKNEDIAAKLYISPNTVKTHIYNIFKKIEVPNRLQAALWAAKNLS